MCVLSSPSHGGDSKSCFIEATSLKIKGCCAHPSGVSGKLPSTFCLSTLGLWDRNTVDIYRQHFQTSRHLGADRILHSPIQVLPQKLL